MFIESVDFFKIHVKEITSEQTKVNLRSRMTLLLLHCRNEQSSDKSETFYQWLALM